VKKAAPLRKKIKKSWQILIICTDEVVFGFPAVGLSRPPNQQKIIAK
jgi:hypothetical protein